jgi:hypothetical protein
MHSPLSLALFDMSHREQAEFQAQQLTLRHGDDQNDRWTYEPHRATGLASVQMNAPTYASAIGPLSPPIVFRLVVPWSDAGQPSPDAA